MLNLHLLDVVRCILEILKLMLRREEFLGDSGLGAEHFNFFGSIEDTGLHRDPVNMRVLIHSIGREDVLFDIVADHVDGLDSGAAFLKDFVLDELVVAEVRPSEILELSFVAMSGFKNCFK